MSALIPAIVEMFIKLNRRGGGGYGGGGGGYGGRGGGQKEPRDEDAYSLKLAERNARAALIQPEIETLGKKLKANEGLRKQLGELNAQFNQFMSRQGRAE